MFIILWIVSNSTGFVKNIITLCCRYNISVNKVSQGIHRTIHCWSVLIFINWTLLVKWLSSQPRYTGYPHSLQPPVYTQPSPSFAPSSLFPGYHACVNNALPAFLVYWCSQANLCKIEKAVDLWNTVPQKSMKVTFYSWWKYINVMFIAVDSWISENLQFKPNLQRTNTNVFIITNKLLRVIILT
jgi:hypothetical protein